MLKGLSGKKSEGFNPQALTTYELCKAFHCLPSQIEKEDNKVIEEMLIIMNAVNEYEQGETKKVKREQLKEKKKYEGVPR